MDKIKKFNYQINCPIFSEYEEKIEKLTQAINSHKISSKKVDKAQELLDIMNILSSCPKYDEKNEDCENCRFIVNLRKETAKMIINANGIARIKFDYTH